MEEQFKFFYYSRSKIGKLLLFYLLLTAAAIAAGLLCCPKYFALIATVIFVCICAVTATAFVFFVPQNLAVIDNRMIKIDHGYPLQWKDIDAAEEVCTNSLCNRKIIVFRMKENFSCPLTFMQKLCKKSCFTPFSIPLYAMTESEQQRIREEIAAHTTLINKTDKK